MGSESCHSPKHQGMQAKHSRSFSKVKTESTLEEGCIVVDVGTLPSALCIHWGRMTDYFYR